MDVPQAHRACLEQELGLGRVLWGLVLAGLWLQRCDLPQEQFRDFLTF